MKRRKKKNGASTAHPGLDSNRPSFLSLVPSRYDDEICSVTLLLAHILEFNITTKIGWLF